MNRILTVIALLLAPLHAADPQEAAKPSGIAASASLVPEEKLVLARYMTKMVPGAAGERDWASPELHDPNGSGSSHVSGNRVTPCFVAPAVTVPRSIARGDSRRHCSADFWANSTS